MEIYIANLISTFVGYFTSIWTNRKDKGVPEKVGIFSLLVVLAITLTYLGQLMVKPPQPIGRELETESRKVSDVVNQVRSSQPSKKEIEGLWIERYTEGQKTIYAIASIRFNPENNHLEFTGNSYDDKLNLRGYWQTIQSKHEGNQYDYLFKGESVNPDKTRRGQGHRKGVGSIWFDNNNHGTGNFFSVRADKELREFELFKILDEAAAKDSIANPQEVIKRLYEDKDLTYFRKITSTN